MALSRQHPLFSRWGCLGGSVLILGIGLAVIFSGGAIFSPGELTTYAERATPLNGFAAHADFQNDCTQCHAPFVGIAPERCEKCHTRVGEERATGTGLHGKLEPAAVARCETCHADHEGRNFNPNADAINKFDHAILGFTLARHIVDYDDTPLACESCHVGADFQFESATCVACHSQHDTAFVDEHTRAFGASCRDCHDGVDQMTGFTHADTDFPLVGQHMEVKCADCHRPETAPQATDTQCAACHAEPPVHAQVFSNQDCADCHTPEAWRPARLPDWPAFKHADTAFQLIHHATGFDGALITCANCHTLAATGDFSLSTETCIDCHSGADADFMAQHVQQYGPDCMGCHDGAGNMLNFDHSQVFALDGAHAVLDCEACHVAQTFRGTPNQCSGCHQEPAIHAGIFGLECAACHTTTAWTPAQLTQHTFPLNHGESGEIPCAVCHVESYTTYTCYGCHEHEPQEMISKHAEKNISGDRLLECAACHATGRKEGDD